jgi:cytochrome c peroxidase
VTLDGMAKAIATYERVASLSGNSKFDRYRAGDQAALSEAEKRGMVLFGERPNPDDDYQETASLQKAKCSLCHQGFNFSDEKFHNLGVGWDETAGKFKDPGRMAVAPIGAKDLKDLGSFKTPTLRDIEKTAPYMHDGSEATLEAVVAYYDRGGNKNPYLDKDMVPLNLTDAEKADLVAFLKAMAGDIKLVELPQLPAGPDGSAPDPKAALEPPVKKAALGSELHGLSVRH